MERTLAFFDGFKQQGVDALPAAILTHALAVDSVASALRAPGTGNAATDMGAVEFLAVKVREAADRLAGAIEERGV
jgi:hypothetical protein